MAPNDRRNSDNSSRNPGLTPIDDATETNTQDRQRDPDRTSGRLPEPADKTPRRHQKKQQLSRKD
jgi:hypothetical protein